MIRVLRFFKEILTLKSIDCINWSLSSIVLHCVLYYFYFFDYKFKTDILNGWISRHSKAHSHTQGYFNSLALTFHVSLFKLLYVVDVFAAAVRSSVTGPLGQDLAGAGLATALDRRTPLPRRRCDGCCCWCCSAFTGCHLWSRQGRWQDGAALATVAKDEAQQQDNCQPIVLTTGWASLHRLRMFTWNYGPN